MMWLCTRIPDVGQVPDLPEPNQRQVGDLPHVGVSVATTIGET